jgi:hypothetical protein
VILLISLTAACAQPITYAVGCVLLQPAAYYGTGYPDDQLFEEGDAESHHVAMASPMTKKLQIQAGMGGIPFPRLQVSTSVASVQDRHFWPDTCFLQVQSLEDAVTQTS